MSDSSRVTWLNQLSCRFWKQCNTGVTPTLFPDDVIYSNSFSWWCHSLQLFSLMVSFTPTLFPDVVIHSNSLSDDAIHLVTFSVLLKHVISVVMIFLLFLTAVVRVCHWQHRTGRKIELCSVLSGSVVVFFPPVEVPLAQWFDFFHCILYSTSIFPEADTVLS